MNPLQMYVLCVIAIIVSAGVYTLFWAAGSDEGKD